MSKMDFDQEVSTWKCGEGYVKSYLEVGPKLIGKERGDEFATSFDLSSISNTLIVGVHSVVNSTTSSQVHTGNVHVYTWESSNRTWSPSTGLAEESWHLFGSRSVAVSNDGSTLALRAMYNNSTDDSPGKFHVRIYRQDDTSSATPAGWTKLGNDIGNVISNDFVEHVGVALSSDGNTVIVGMNEGGNAQVLNWDSIHTEWIQLGQDLSPGTVAISGNGQTIAIGQETNSDYRGNMRIFTWNQLATKWLLEANVDGTEGSFHCGFSIALSEDGNVAAMGCTGNIFIPLKGHVQIFERNEVDAAIETTSTSIWRQIGLDIEETPDSIDISSDGSVVSIGSPYYDFYESRSGRTNVYRRNATDNWVQVGFDLEGQEDNEFFGYSTRLSADASTLIVGSPFEVAGDRLGVIRTYTLGCEYTGADLSSPTSREEATNSISYGIILALLATCFGMIVLFACVTAKSKVDSKKKESRQSEIEQPTAVMSGLHDRPAYETPRYEYDNTHTTTFTHFDTAAGPSFGVADAGSGV